MAKNLSEKKIITLDNKPNLIAIALTLQAAEDLLAEALPILAKITRELKQHLADEDK